MIKKWRDVPGYAGLMASENGEIRVLPRKVRCRGGYRTVRERTLKPWVIKSTGYQQIQFCGKGLSVHRLVALAWCDGYFPGALVDHINNVRDDNRALNLQWVSASENQRLSYSRDGKVSSWVGKYSAEHATAKAVISVCIVTGERRVWPSAMDAVRAGFDSSCVSRCCHGLSSSHRGHKWLFAGVLQ